MSIYTKKSELINDLVYYDFRENQESKKELGNLPSPEVMSSQVRTRTELKP
jgi:hypothetical protein